MNPRSTVIVSLLVLGVLFHACPTESCLKKTRALLRSKGKEEKPAELERDEASFIKYSHAQRDNYYMEILQNETDKTIVVRELSHPPIALSQVAGEEFLESTERPFEPDPDAEYIHTHLDETQADSPAPASAEKSTAMETITVIPETVGSGEVTTEEVLTPEDENVRREWGGECTAIDWNRCNKIRQIVVLDVINNQFERKNLELDCLVQPVLCLKNGWTANRCHILCMAAQCNKQIFFDWDAVVDFEGPCRYRK